jgi:hypothetical protein
VYLVRRSESRLPVGFGCTCEIQVDPTEVHVRGDIPFLSGLLAAPLTAGLKQIVQRNFNAPAIGMRREP